MATTFAFIPGRSQKSQQILYNGYRYSHEKTREDRSYWVCTASSCSSRLAVLDHTTIVKQTPHSHPPPVDENSAHVAKQGLNRKAATTDDSTKSIVADTVAPLPNEVLSKLNCNEDSLYKMARRARLGPLGFLRTVARKLCVEKF